MCHRSTDSDPLPAQTRLGWALLIYPDGRQELPQEEVLYPDSEGFDKEFDSRRFSEQGFSIGKGSLNLDALKDRATLHATLTCVVMLGVAKTATEIGDHTAYSMQISSTTHHISSAIVLWKAWSG